MKSSTPVTPMVVRRKPQCRICNSEETKDKGTKRGRFVVADFHFYQCSDCGFLFVEPVTDFGIYDDAYYAGRGADPLVNYQAEYSNYNSTPRRFEFQNLVDFAQKHLGRQNGTTPSEQQGVSWLDFGCGAGGLLECLRDLEVLEYGGVRVPVHPVGHDVGSHSERLKSEDGFEILDWDELRTTSEARFDIITCIEVIEHVPYPRPVIELLAHCLKPGGLLMLTTANLDCPLAKLQGIHFAYCIPEIHISLFNPPLLCRLYREADLTPIRFQHSGIIKFRFLKNLARIPGGNALACLANFPPILLFADYLFGVSAMPSAVKAMPLATP